MVIILLVVFFWLWFSIKSCVADLSVRQKTVPETKTLIDEKKDKEKDQEQEEKRTKEIKEIKDSKGIQGIKVEMIEIKQEAGGRIYCYTTILAETVPVMIQHVWIRPDGQEHLAIDLKISNNPAYTWSYISLHDKPAGEWRVEVRSSDGTAIGEKSFTLD